MEGVSRTDRDILGSGLKVIQSPGKVLFLDEKTQADRNAGARFAVNCYNNPDKKEVFLLTFKGELSYEELFAICAENEELLQKIVKIQNVDSCYEGFKNAVELLFIKFGPSHNSLKKTEGTGGGVAKAEASSTQGAYTGYNVALLCFHHPLYKNLLGMVSEKKLDMKTLFYLFMNTEKHIAEFIRDEDGDDRLANCLSDFGKKMDALLKTDEKSNGVEPSEDLGGGGVKSQEVLSAEARTKVQQCYYNLGINACIRNTEEGPNRLGILMQKLLAAGPETMLGVEERRADLQNSDFIEENVKIVMFIEGFLGKVQEYENSMLEEKKKAETAFNQIQEEIFKSFLEMGVVVATKFCDDPDSRKLILEAFHDRTKIDVIFRDYVLQKHFLKKFQFQVSGKDILDLGKYDASLKGFREGMRNYFNENKSNFENESIDLDTLVQEIEKVNGHKPTAKLKKPKNPKRVRQPKTQDVIQSPVSTEGEQLAVVAVIAASKPQLPANSGASKVAKQKDTQKKIEKKIQAFQGKVQQAIDGGLTEQTLNELREIIEKQTKNLADANQYLSNCPEDESETIERCKKNSQRAQFILTAYITAFEHTQGRIKIEDGYKNVLEKAQIRDQSGKVVSLQGIFTREQIETIKLCAIYLLRKPGNLALGTNSERQRYAKDIENLMPDNEYTSKDLLFNLGFSKTTVFKVLEDALLIQKK